MARLEQFNAIMDMMLPKEWKTYRKNIGEKVIYKFGNGKMVSFTLGHAPSEIGCHGLEDCLWAKAVSADGNQMDCTAFAFKNYFMAQVWSPCRGEPGYERVPRVDSERMEWDVRLAPTTGDQANIKVAVNEYLELWS